MSKIDSAIEKLKKARELAEKLHKIGVFERTDTTDEEEKMIGDLMRLLDEAMDEIADLNCALDSL